jgi:fluoride exporter
MKLILLIGAGGFMGSVSRYFVTQWVHRIWMLSFPVGTLAVNIAGCFLIGLFYGFSEKGSLISADWKMFLTVGFCGGFTTFSTFTNDSLVLMRDGQFNFVLLYAGMSVLFGLTATFLGNLITRLI